MWRTSPRCPEIQLKLGLNRPKLGVLRQVCASLTPKLASRRVCRDRTGAKPTRNLFAQLRNWPRFRRFTFQMCTTRSTVAGMAQTMHGPRRGLLTYNEYRLVAGISGPPVPSVPHVPLVSVPLPNLFANNGKRTLATALADSTRRTYAQNAKTGQGEEKGRRTSLCLSCMCGYAYGYARDNTLVVTKLHHCPCFKGWRDPPRARASVCLPRPSASSLPPPFRNPSEQRPWRP